MPKYTPEPVWRDMDVFLIGGGPSLRGFRWELLKEEMTIGCNTAFTLGTDVCKICHFGDNKWFKVFEIELAGYAKKGGVVITSSPQLQGTRIPWLWVMGREAHGLSMTTLGWNGNTGASAINLALLLGAGCIYLLGFDMKMTHKLSNWHNKVIDRKQVGPEVYPKFVKQFEAVAKDLPKKFPGRAVINVTADSDLNCFPKVDPARFWAERGMVQMGFEKKEAV